MIWSRIVISLLPVLVLALVLRVLDSYKLVKWPAIGLSLLKGGLAALCCLVISQLLMHWVSIPFVVYSRYLAPLIEEIAKASFLWYLINSKRIGFLVDAAIHGAAIGAGFAVLENTLYLLDISNTPLIVWYIRGFGTAIMHASCTVMFGMLCKRMGDRQDRLRLTAVFSSLFVAVVIHSVYNHFFLPPIMITIAMVLVLPPLIVFIYENSERSLRSWLNMGMDEDMDMLEMILSGRVTQSRMGTYLHAIRNHFDATVAVDVLCYLRIYLELAIRAKGILLLRQNGIPVQPDPAIRDKFLEFSYLEKSIGKTGKLAIAPFMRLGDRELWQLYMLGDQKN